MHHTHNHNDVPGGTLMGLSVCEKVPQSIEQVVWSMVAEACPSGLYFLGLEQFGGGRDGQLASPSVSLQPQLPKHRTADGSLAALIRVHMDVPHRRRIYPALPPPGVVQASCGIRGHSSDLDLCHMAVLGGGREHPEQDRLSAGGRESMCVRSVLRTDSGPFRCSRDREFHVNGGHGGNVVAGLAIDTL